MFHVRTISPARVVSDARWSRSVSGWPPEVFDQWNRSAIGERFPRPRMGMGSQP